MILTQTVTAAVAGTFNTASNSGNNSNVQPLKLGEESGWGWGGVGWSKEENRKDYTSAGRLPHVKAEGK